MQSSFRHPWSPKSQGCEALRPAAGSSVGYPHRVTTAVDETQRLLPVDIVERVKKKGLLFEPDSEELDSSAGPGDAVPIQYR